ncbi:MAG: hypothetical protein JO144_02710 [Actinobacteria bacterium]|nr:hypothetical protein [Actinomycetota bacterium]
MGAAVTAVVLLLAGCTASHPHTERPGSARTSRPPAGSGSVAGTVAAAPAGGSVGHGQVHLDRLTASVPGSSATLTAQPASLTAAGAQQLAYFATRFGSHVGAPVQLTSSAPLPAGGAVVTRSYPSPLPEYVAATLMYFDPQLGGWRTVPSTLSKDRRTVTAHVHHFSAWTDVTATVGGWVDGVGNGVTWTLGSMFDTRVAAPTCTKPVPSWVDSTVFLDGLNTPLRWCVGRDPQHSDRLVVKVRVNRGYGASLQTTTDPQWSWNSFLDRSSASVLTHLLTDYTAEAGRYASVLLQPGAQVIPGGEEVDFGFTEAQVRRAQGAGVALVTVNDSTLTDLVMDLIMQQIADVVGNKQVAYVVGVLTVLRCGGSIVRAGANPAALSGAIARCVADSRDIIAHQIADSALNDLSLSPKDAAKIGVDAAKKLGLVAAAGITFQLVSDLEDLHLDSASRVASVFPKIIKTAPGCLTATQLVAALPDAMRKLVASKYGRLGHGVDLIQCANGWAAAGVDFYTPGSCCGPSGGNEPVANTATIVLHYVGAWKVVDREAPCAAGDVPKAIYPLACMSN